MATIRKRGSSWQVQVRHNGEPPRTKTFRCKREAQIWAYKVEATSGRHSPTVGSLLARYELSITAGKKGADRERFKISVITRSALAALDPYALTGKDLAEYRDERLTGVTGGTVRREMAVLRHCLSIARREWGLSDLPDAFAAFRMPKQGRSRTRRLSMKEDELLSVAVRKSKAWYLPSLVGLALATAMRRGELLSLQWSWINLFTRVVSLPDTKNGDGRRIPLSPDAVRLIAGIPVRNERLFPLKPGTASEAWERAVRRAGIDDLRFHDLRHEAISRFFERGLSVPEVALISGHKDVRMLFRYTHLRAEDVAKKLNFQGK